MAKILIIGGVAGGATTAARLRRNDEKAEIIVFERGKYISYANCGLPYYIGNVIKERDKLLVQTPESFNKRFNVDIRVCNEVIKIYRDEKKVEVKNVDTGATYFETYDKLVLSPGAEPVIPPIEGVRDPLIFTLRNVADTDIIKEYIIHNEPKTALVVGAGFIGLEMAENLYHLGIRVTIVEMAEQVMTPLDYEMAAQVHQHLKTKNVQFYLKDGVSTFTRKDGVLNVNLKSGKVLKPDLVILSIGVRPETSLAKISNIAIGERGGILINEFMQTNDPDIYALGDAIEFINPIIGKSTTTYLAGPANKQGRIVADNITYSNSKKYKGSIGTAIAKVFDITVASCGISEKILRKENIPYLSSIVHNSSHAGYYPGAKPLTLKIMFSPVDGKLLGGQIVGYDGVDKTADIIAAMLQNKGTVYDLVEFEHAYAPPFNSAKSPINVAGYVAENILKDRLKIIHWYELKEMHSPDLFLMDVRTAEEFVIGTIPDAINIPVDEIRSRINEIPKDKKIIIFCGVGLRGYVAYRMLLQLGFENMVNLNGGYKTYDHVTQKQSNEDIFENDYIGNDDNIYQVHPDAIRDTTFTGFHKIDVDACGLQCPGPILKLKKAVNDAGVGDEITVTSTDQGFFKDAQAWARMTNNKVMSMSNEAGIITATIKKNPTDDSLPKPTANANNKTFVVFSDDFDKALASFVIANGAASTGKKVTMFFTFWGLNIIKKKDKPSTKKDIFASMFGFFMPSSSKGLKLSKLNFLGMGPVMMRMIMRNKRIESLESLMQSAIDAGVNLMACQMSMDVMGISKEELLDEVQIGGVATYLEEAEQASLNLFI